MAKKRQVAVEMDLKEKKVEGRKCPLFRVSYPHVFEPTDFDGNGDMKYRLVMLFPKKSDLTALKKAAENAKIEALGKDKTKWPKNLVSPFNDGDEAQDKGEAYEGHWYVSASSKTKPQVIDKNLEPITDSEDFYAGCYAKASLIAFYYDVGKNKGVSFALQHLQKVKDGDALSGKPSANEEFEVEDDGSENEENYSDNDSEESALAASDDNDDVGF